MLSCTKICWKNTNFFVGFFYLNYFCFCSIIFYSYAIVLFLLYFVENRTVTIRSVSNGYCILDQNGTVHWTEPLKLSRLNIRTAIRRRAHLIPIRKPHNNFQLLRFILLLRSSILKKHDESFCNYFHFRKEYRERNSRFFLFRYFNMFKNNQKSWIWNLKTYCFIFKIVLNLSMV